jgi:hypothetical protein
VDVWQKRNPDGKDPSRRFTLNLSGPWVIVSIDWTRCNFKVKPFDLETGHGNYAKLKAKEPERIAVHHYVWSSESTRK